MWSAAALLVLALAGLPLIVLPAPLLVPMALLSALVCAGGMAALSMPVLTAGATLAAVEYAVALWIGGRPLDVLPATVFGVLLFLLLALADFMARARGVVVTAPARTTIMRHWLALVGAAVIVVVVLVVAAAALAPLVRSLPYPAATGLGAASAVLVAIGVLKLLATTRDADSRRGADDASLA